MAAWPQRSPLDEPVFSVTLKAREEMEHLNTITSIQLTLINQASEVKRKRRLITCGLSRLKPKKLMQHACVSTVRRSRSKTIIFHSESGDP
ncbi:Eukaryotic Translation Initiation Factor 2D [Manis pentadactyla]|nr:Eukaryotic Translation Initiation Factor 2D [Manis pentadactyla]